MNINFDKWGRERMLVSIIILFLITHLAMLTFVPFIADEGPYSIMIEEQIEHPTTVVTFLGYPVAWKPPVMFWTYGFFVQSLRGLPIPIEAVYRLPGMLFALANSVLIFLIFEKLLKDTRQAFLIAIVYQTLFLPINVDSRVLTDTMCGTAIFAGILAYVHGLSDRRMFLAGGLLTFIAYFIKQANAATVPFVAAALLFDKDRKKLKDPLFLLSLTAFPMAMWLFNASIGAGAGADTIYMAQNRVIENLDPIKIASSMMLLFPLAATWLPASLFGFWKNWRREPMMTVWYCLTIFPLLGGTLMPFYFYPVMPAMAYFALQLILRDVDGTVKMDKLFWFALISMGIVCLLAGLITQAAISPPYAIEKSAGEFLAGKENVLIVGKYEPGVFSYKMLEEKRATGTWVDYGLVIIPDSDGGLYRPFMENYSVKQEGVIDGNFGALFALTTTFRKDTNITRFDYIAITGNSTVRPDGKLVLNGSSVQIYDVR